MPPPCASYLSDNRGKYSGELVETVVHSTISDLDPHASRLNAGRSPSPDEVRVPLAGTATPTHEELPAPRAKCSWTLSILGDTEMAERSRASSEEAE